MASMTSFCNATLWRKSMHRFWPLWAAYLVGWLFLLPLNLLTNYFSYQSWMAADELPGRLVRMVNDIPDFLQPGVWLAAGYGLLCAMAVFGYLYNNRSAAMMHALPLRRESLFGTQYLAGLCYFLLPHLLVGALTLAVCLLILPAGSAGEGAAAVGIWFLVQTGTSLFFFSFAAFCAMFTGHIIALPAFYGILNVLVYVIYTLITALMSELFYGYEPGSSTGEGLVRLLTPLYALTEACNWRAVYADTPNTKGDYEIIEYILESPEAVLGYAVAGLVLTALAVMVYRRRHVESAGDVVCFPLVRPIFKIGVAFCVGLCLGCTTAAFFGWLGAKLAFTICILIWTVVGWFAAEMLLKKSFRVLRAWKGCLAMVAAMALLCAACCFDWFGVVSRVPKAAEVSMLTVDTRLGYPNDKARWVSLTTADPEEVQQFIDLHHAVIRERERSEDGYSSGDDYTSITLTYTLSNGSILRRSYHSVPLYQAEQEEEGSVTWCCDRLLRNRDLVAQAYNFAACDEGRVTEAWLDNVLQVHYIGTRTYESVALDDFSAQELQTLWEAVKADFAAGTLGRRYLFETQERWDNTYFTDLSFTFLVNHSDDGKTLSTSTRHFTITLTPQAEHTLAWLEEHDALGSEYALSTHEYTDGKSLFYDKYAPTEASIEVIAGVDH